MAKGSIVRAVTDRAGDVYRSAEKVVESASDGIAVVVPVIMVYLATLDPCLVAALTPASIAVLAIASLGVAYVSRSVGIAAAIGIAWAGCILHARTCSHLPLRPSSVPGGDDAHRHSDAFTVRAPEPPSTDEHYPGIDPVPPTQGVPEPEEGDGRVPLTTPELIAAAQTNDVPPRNAH